MSIKILTRKYGMLVLTLMPLITQAQEIKITQLRQLYDQNNYKACYEKANEKETLEGIEEVMLGLSFYHLPDRSDIKNDINDPVLHTLTILDNAKKSNNIEHIEDSSFYIREFKKIQDNVFSKAKSWYNSGLHNKATKYFDALHETFDNTKTIFVNHYGFDDDYFLGLLKNDIDIPEEFYSYYKKEYNLLEKYYYSNEKYKEWNNPLYRMANTARDADYENKDEKMVFYFLNLVRMNPELFLETFLKTRLHIRYHDDLELQIPVFDTLSIKRYSNRLTFEEFLDLPVHKLYNNDLSENVIERYVKTTVVKKTTKSTSYRFDINYRGFYDYLKNNQPKLLNLRNLNNYTKTEEGEELILFKLYDKKFTIYEKAYKEETSDHYHQSLFKQLSEMDSRPLIFPNKKLFKLAECWAVEAGKRNLKGHDRVNCPYGYDSECCDYGNKNGFDVVISLLIDRYVPDLGHRKTLLGYYLEMGVAIRPHQSSFKYNAVLDFFK
jgi:hypothetical protein